MRQALLAATYRRSQGVYWRQALLHVLPAAAGLAVGEVEGQEVLGEGAVGDGLVLGAWLAPLLAVAWSFTQGKLTSPYG